MREKQRIQDDLERIYQRFGYQPFQWGDVRDIVTNSPQYYAGIKVFEMKKNKDGKYIYKIPDGFFEDKKFRLKKKPIYPVKIWFGEVMH